MTGIRLIGLVIGVFIGGSMGFAAAEEPGRGDTLTIGAAHSLKPAFQEIVPMFEKEYGATVHILYSPSQTLRRQIEKGAPIDVFLPAAAEEVEKLQQKGLTLGAGARIYAQTSLVLVMSTASRVTSVSFRDALPDRTTRIALGDPRTSALGEITNRALAPLNSAYKNRFNLLYAQHNEELVNLLDEGKADIGIVYRVDAINNGHVRIIDETPAGTHTSVQFGGAVVWTCQKTALGVAGKFLDFMMTPRIQKLLLKYGFDAVP